MKRRLSFFCKDPLQEFARTTVNPRKKGEFMYHSFFKISRNIDSQACREVHGILETSIVQESKKDHVPHVLSDGLGHKIQNEFKFKSVFKG